MRQTTSRDQHPGVVLRQSMPVANGRGAAHPLAGCDAAGAGVAAVRSAEGPAPGGSTSAARGCLRAGRLRPRHLGAPKPPGDGGRSRRADLVLGMSRAHVRHAVVIAPEIWPRAFTLKELLRRGMETGPRRPGEPVADWLARVHEGRERVGLARGLPGGRRGRPDGRPAAGLRGHGGAAERTDGPAGRALLGATRGPAAGEAVTPRRRSSSHPRTWPAPPAPHPDRPSGPSR